MSDQANHPGWGIAKLLLSIIGVLVIIWAVKSLFYGEGIKKDKKIDNYQEEAISYAEARVTCQNQVLTLKKSLRQEKEKVDKIRNQYDIRKAELERQVEEIFELNTLSENLVETYFEKKWCLGSKCLMERISPAPGVLTPASK